MAFYDLNVNQDSYFWSAKQITSNTGSELESFVELVGGISSRESALASDLTVQHKERSAEFAKAVDQLIANNEQSMIPVVKSSIVKQAMQEGAKEQARALLGADAGPDGALFAGGLVPSADGLSWSAPTPQGHQTVAG
jgi:halogenation protein CepH